MSTRAHALGLLALASLALPHPSVADVSARVLSSDAHGVTLQVDLPAPRLQLQANGTQTLVVAGLASTDVPGRPGMPFYSTLVALPPGARASARVQQESPWTTMGTASLAIAGKPGFKGREAANLVATRDPVEAITDGPWPRQTVEVGAPFSLRRQRMVAIQVRPFRWDASTRQVSWTSSVTVRVDFVGGTSVSGAPAAEDKHWEPVLEQALINYSQAREWRGRPGAPRAASSTLIGRPLAGTASRAGFDESFPEVRVQLDSTGVYEIPFSELTLRGYPSGIAISQVSVHRHEFVENASPPYVTIELPIEVIDADGNGIFDGDDVIRFFAQSWAERSRASWPLRAWGDGEVVYATAVSGTGLRMRTRPGWRNVPGLTPLASYPWRQHWERNFTPFLFPPDTLTDQFHWTEISLYYYRPDTLAFETNDLDTTHAVTVSLNWVGRRIYQRHFEWAQYRKAGGPFITIADSSTASWLGCAPFTATVTSPGSTLGEGNVNTIRVWGRSPDVATNDADNVSVNWFEASYWRRYRALFEYLPCNSADGSGEIQIAAGGFLGNSIRVYDVTDSLSPVALQIDPAHIQPTGGPFYQAEFQDSVAAGAPHRYVAFSQAKTPLGYSAVTRRHLTARGSGDYLLVVPEAFLPAVEPLRQLRANQGLDVVVAPLESVNDEFNGGRHADFAIKRLVRYAYEHWNAKFLLLVGDGSEDPQNFMKNSSTDWIPVHNIKGPVGVEFGTEIIPSDPWYVCMENCDLSQLQPVLQDLFVGRLPVQSLQQAQDVIGKIVSYEDLSGDQSWRRNILLCDDDDYSAESFFGGGTVQIGYCLHPSERVLRQLDETIADLIHNQAGLQQAVLDTFHLDTMLERVACLDPSCNCKDQPSVQQATHPTITGDLINRLNAGRLWWNFQGHANEFVLTHEDLYVNRGVEDDKDLLLNDHKPFLFSAFSCHANAFARIGDQGVGRGPAIGEDLINLPLRGSIGSYASTGYEILPFNGNSHIDVSWADAMFSHPPHDTYLGDNGARVVLGETIALALARYLPGLPYGSSESGVGLTYHLLGDPGTRLSIGPPEATVTANQLPVTSGQRVALHTVGDTLRLEADLVSNVQLTAIRLDRTDAAGTVTIPATDYTLTPAFPDTLPNGQGGRRYHLSYGTTLVPDSYTYTFHTTDRYGVPGSFDVVFQFVTTLLVDGTAIRDNDPVAPTANLTMRVLSPKPLDPANDLTLAINGVPQSFTATPVAGDASGREWVLSWAHGPYPIDHYEARLTVAGGGVHNLHFRVDVGGSELQVQNPLTFPNPFDDAGTSFSFLLVSGSNVDLQIRVFTTSGHLIYERDERGMSPGYHQLRWDGRDAEGDEIANGVYVYRMLATNGPTKAEVLGRMVKLRKPHHADSP